jgi:hypothetical protein
MPVYARSDVVCVTVSHSHGGCGTVHARPVVNGAPAKVWSVDCPQCKDYLAKDPLWSTTLADVPSSPDEDLARDNAEKSTTRSREDIMALALAKIAGLPVTEFLGGMLGQAADQGTVKCVNNHENFPSAKFCAECGAPLNVPAGDVVSGEAAAPTLAAPKPPAVRQPRTPRVPRTPAVK